MSWFYQQSTGELLRDGEYVATGYSGHGEGLNNPECQAIADVGPIPTGKYLIGPAHYHAKKGPVVMTLTPIDHDCCGRDGFLIHGDNVEMDHSASHGCIILSREAREKIAASADRELLVIV